MVEVTDYQGRSGVDWSDSAPEKPYRGQPEEDRLARVADSWRVEGRGRTGRLYLYDDGECIVVLD